MKRIIFINSDYEYLRDVIESIPDNFKWMGATVKSGRNEIKYFNTLGMTLVIKSFCKITLANRVIYALFRKPKSQRSYENSEYLMKIGIETPTPVAYISTYRAFMLKKDFYVSLYIDYQHVNILLSNSLPQSEIALRAFANFTYKLHSNGIFHCDYNLNNILYSFNGLFYRFSLIDNNRIRFVKYKTLRGVRNLQRLQLPVENIAVICSEYSRQSNINELKTILGMSIFRLQYITFNAFRRKLKSIAKTAMVS